MEGLGIGVRIHRVYCHFCVRSGVQGGRVEAIKAVPASQLFLPPVIAHDLSFQLIPSPSEPTPF